MQENPGKVPVLTAGIVSPVVLHDFSIACEDFFATKDIEAGHQVRRIIVGFADGDIRNWIDNDRETLVALSFKDFMAQLRGKFLEADWVSKLRSEIF